MRQENVKASNIGFNAVVIILLMCFTVSFIERSQAQDVNTLIGQLRNPSASVRSQAASALGETRDARAVPPLISALKDKDAEVRDAAVYGLVTMGKPAVEDLIAALKHDHIYVRGGAAEALGHIKDRRAVEPLIAVLSDKSRTMRCQGADALGALKATAAVEPLIIRVKDNDPFVRARAAGALGEIKDPRAVEPLIAALTDTHAYPRWKSAEALGKLKDARAVDPLISALNDKHPFVRGRAAGALGELKAARAVDPLVAALKDEHWFVQTSAAKSLGDMNDPRGIEIILASAGQEYIPRKVHIDLVFHLSTVRAVQHMAHVLSNIEGVEPLGDLRDMDAAIALLEIVKDGSQFFGNNVIETLTHLRQLAVDPSIAALSDKNPRVRGTAARALGKISQISRKKANRAVEPLISLLKDKDPSVRARAAGALMFIPDARAADPLVAALQDKDSYVRMEAANALGSLGPPAVEPLTAALKHKNSDVRESAAWALSVTKDPRAAPPLIAALKRKDLEVVTGAYRFFIRRGEPGSENILIKAFMKCAKGRRQMVEDFLNCGNTKLEATAREWIEKRDPEINVTPGRRGGPIWGKNP